MEDRNVLHGWAPERRPDQKSYCEHEPLLLFGRRAQQRCIPHGQLGSTHLEWPSV